MRPGKVIEGPVRDHPHGATRRMGCLSHGIETSIATDSNHGRPFRCRRGRRLPGNAGQFGRATSQQRPLSPVRCKRRVNHRALGINIQRAGSSVDHEQ